MMIRWMNAVTGKMTNSVVRPFGEDWFSMGELESEEPTTQAVQLSRKWDLLDYLMSVDAEAPVWEKIDALLKAVKNLEGAENGRN